MLEIQVQSLCIQQKLLIQDLHIQIPNGAIHTLMGGSGCGKSSLLCAITNCLPNDFIFQGHIFLNQQNLFGLGIQERKIGMLFQESLLFPHFTVLENLLFAVPQKYSKNERNQLALQALQDAQLLELAPLDPAVLSGGQKARVALMRALLAQPRALLLDEPFSKLDQSLRESIRSFVFETVKKRSIPVLIVTHDKNDIADPNRLTLLNLQT